MKVRSLVGFIVIIILIAGLGYSFVAGLQFGLYDFNVVNNIKRGLDLTGGVASVYEAVDSDQIEDLDTKIEGAMAVFRNRLDKAGYTEATITRQGTNRIRIEVPINESSGITNPEEILAFIGKPAKLEFKDPEDNVIITGNDIVSAQAVLGTGQQYEVAFSLTNDGAAKFGDATTKYVGDTIGIYLDDSAISTPTVQNAITGGSGVITGEFTLESAQLLAIQIESGAFPLELKEIEVRSISATLGEDALNKGIMAGLIGIAVVMVFMIAYYRLPGLVADIALLIYMLLVLFALATIKGVQLTLPGVAGIILSIGMAVDANVIIFERIKEELKAGKPLKTAVNLGFHKALSAIIDSNVTTIIAAAVLMIFGTGTIKGFAITLMIGIVASMVTAVFITRGLLKLMINLNLVKPGLYIRIEKNKDTEGGLHEDI